jgi:hypothetical protein
MLIGPSSPPARMIQLHLFTQPDAFTAVRYHDVAQLLSRRWAGYR